MTVILSTHESDIDGRPRAVIITGPGFQDHDIVVDDNIVTCSYYGEVGLFMRTAIAIAEERHGVLRPAA